MSDLVLARVQRDNSAEHVDIAREFALDLPLPDPEKYFAHLAAFEAGNNLPPDREDCVPARPTDSPMQIKLSQDRRERLVAEMRDLSAKEFDRELKAERPVRLGDMSDAYPD